MKKKSVFKEWVKYPIMYGIGVCVILRDVSLDGKISGDFIGKIDSFIRINQMRTMYMIELQNGQWVSVKEYIFETYESKKW